MPIVFFYSNYYKVCQVNREMNHLSHYELNGLWRKLFIIVLYELYTQLIIYTTNYTQLTRSSLRYVTRSYCINQLWSKYYSIHICMIINNIMKVDKLSLDKHNAATQIIKIKRKSPADLAVKFAICY